MDGTKFEEFRHAAVHQLMQLNKRCDQEFQIPSWPRWNYSLNPLRVGASHCQKALDHRIGAGP
jgi:hypothetical protein